VRARLESIVSIASLGDTIKSAEARAVDVATAGKKWLNDFKAELVRDLAVLRSLYIRNVQVIRGLCTLISVPNHLPVEYIWWLSMAVAGLPEMFAGVNENFVSATVEGALVVIGESIDLDAFQDVVAESRAYILPADRDVRRAARALSKKWWRSFGYNYVMAAIRTKIHEVTADAYFFLYLTQ
jgi:hypothetical protein